MCVCRRVLDVIKNTLKKLSFTSSTFERGSQASFLGARELACARDEQHESACASACSYPMQQDVVACERQLEGLELPDGLVLW